jgi:hypothetical protein|tara:strand:- start:592 stop:1002 length:411 start_codon:yes stop_codon:yes gene_type:complete
MFGNLLFPGLILMALTMVVSFYHTYGSMRLMKPGNDWEKGIPSDPYPNAPKDLQMVKNNIKNLFEYPIIFYALLILIYTLDKSDMPFIYLSWIYVLLRIIHSFYHIFMDNTHLRGGFWLISQFILLAILIRFIIII